MANKYLNDTGLLYFYNKLKTVFQQQESGKGLSTNDYTTTEKNKLAGIASGAQVNKIETVKVNGTALTITSKAVDVAVPTKTSDLTNDSNFPVDSSYVHTDNNYTTTDKNKLAGIASGAEVNQNAFSNVKVGSTTVAADTKTDTLTIAAGSNVTITPDATNDKITIEATDTTYTPASESPIMDGTAAVGTSAKYAREDHVHPSDTSRVPTTRKVAGHELSADVTISKSDVGLGNVDNTADTNKAVASAGKLTSPVNVEGVKFDGSAAVSHYATCSTAAATVAKEATITPATTNFELATGARVFVKFTYAIGVASATLNVNGTGAKAIYYNGSALAKNLTDANGTYEFIYNGTQWELVGDLDTNTTYSTLTQAIVDAGTETTGKLITAKILKDTITSATVTVDSALSDTSENPVQNKVIKEKFDGYNGEMSGKITSNVDLNDYKTAGVYYCDSEHTYQNKPSSLAWGYLFVEKYQSDIASTVQTFYNTNGTYKRLFINSEWRDWERLTKDSDLDVYAKLASPTFTGTPKAPTASAGTNSTQIATTAFVKTAVDNAVAGITQFDIQVVTALPDTGVKGTIYLLSHSHGTGDVYDEYIWTGSGYEKIGNTDIDLSGYLKKTDMVAITTSEIDTLFA